MLLTAVDLARIELASQQCECRVLPLDYRPIAKYSLVGVGGENAVFYH